jgi:hypothetical protein
VTAFDVVSDVPGIEMGRADCCARPRSMACLSSPKRTAWRIAPADALITYFEQHPTAFVPADLDMPWPRDFSRQAVHKWLYRW